MRKVFLVLLVCFFCISGCGSAEKEKYYDRGISKMEEEDYQGAIAEFDLSIAEEVRLAESYRAKGISHMELQDYSSAIAAFSRSLNSLDQSDAEFELDVMYYLAAVRETYGETDKVIGVYTDILKKGKDIESLFQRGRLYLLGGRSGEAADDFAMALEKSRDYSLYIDIFQVYEEQSMTAEGTKYLEMALEVEPESGADYYQRGRVYYCMKDYEAAKGELTEAIKKEDQDAILLLGKVYLIMEDAASARAMYQDYLNSKENPAKAYNGMALCDIYEKNYDSALNYIQQGLEYNDPEEQQSLLFNEIVAYEYKLDFETAKQKMAAYLETYPEDAAAIRENEFLQSR